MQEIKEIESLLVNGKCRVRGKVCKRHVMNIIVEELTSVVGQASL